MALARMNSLFEVFLASSNCLVGERRFSQSCLSCLICCLIFLRYSQCLRILSSSWLSCCSSRSSFCSRDLVRYREDDFELLSWKTCRSFDRPVITGFSVALASAFLGPLGLPLVLCIPLTRSSTDTKLKKLLKFFLLELSTS